MKTFRRHVCGWALGALAGLAAAAPPAGRGYVATEIDAPALLGESNPYGLNVKGQVVGLFFSSATHGLHGFSTSDVVGASSMPDGSTHVLLAPRGQAALRDLGTLGGTYGFASHVSDSGLVVGGASVPNGDTHAFVAHVGGGELVDLGLPEGVFLADAVDILRP